MKEIGEIFPDDEKLKDSIRVLYAISIEFCIKALCFLRKPGMKQFAKSTWKPFKFEFQDIENELADRREIINDQIRVASEKAAAFARQKALIYQAEGYLHREYEVTQWDRSQEWRIEQDVYKKEKAMDKLLAELSAHNHTRPFLNAKDLRHPDTGKLFFESPQFKSWYNCSGGSLLWYQGIPGAGKTILASAVIDHLLDNVGGAGQAIIYFFCDSQDTRSLERRTLLSSLLKQIITLNRPLLPALRSQLETTFKNPQSQPPLQTLQNLLVTHIQQKHLTYIVVDGVDELDVRDRKYILDQFNEMLKLPGSILKVFILSRPEIDLPRTSRKAIFASPQSALRPELDAYVRDSLQKFDNLTSFPPKFMSEIQTALINGADGMFLWVEFQLREIENKDRMVDIRKVIQNLPRGLDETYARILRKIMEHRNPEKALKIFKWLSTSRRPLMLEELQEAIAIDTSDTYHAQIKNRKTLDSFFELRDCANLAVLNERDDTVQFAHSTVRDFLLKESTIIEFPSLYLDLISAKAEICNACLTYLSLNDFESQIETAHKRPPLPKESILENPASWVPTLLKSRSIPAMVAGFYLNWCRPNSSPKPAALFRQKIKQPPTQLELLRQSFTFLDYNGADPNSCYGGITALAKASRSGQSENVRTLLAAGADVNAADEYGGLTALQAAARGGHLDVVERLLAAKANVNASTGHQGLTALRVAAENGQLDVVEKLLAVNADLNAIGRDGQTALQAAHGRGFFDVVKRLRAAGAKY
ncbi:hypothetical protein TWF173_010315 [Orbilia oligospora]|nr:hypothetical protein TWF173_010315 [Orbilia oligospora]